MKRCNHLATALGFALALASAGVTAVDEAEALIEQLQLEPHVEGGYFRRTFQADHRPKISTPGGERFTLTSIYYMLTADAPIGHWHLNRSDIIHFYHLGAPITYYLIYPDGRLETVVLGPDPGSGHKLQFAVPGGVWKATHLQAGSYGLLSEAVAPGFEYEDMTLGQRDRLLAEFPQHAELVRRYSPD